MPRIDPPIGYLGVTLKSNDAAANSNGDGLGPIPGSKFFHDAFDVHLDGLLGDYQPLANIAIAVAFGDSPENFDFTLGKRFAAHVDRQIFGQICRKMLASTVHLADGPDQLVERVCEQARRAGAGVVTLWVTEVNDRARAFYRRLGFAPTGARQLVWPQEPDHWEEELARRLT